MIDQHMQPERQSISEMVLKIYVSWFLRQDLTSDEMIRVFGLIEDNDDGSTRIHRLIEEKCTIQLSQDQIEEAIGLLSDYPEQISKKSKLGKRHLTEKVIGLDNAGFLNPTLTADQMICVFDLIEHNPNGNARILRLIEEECTKVLTDQEMKEATQLLED